MAEVDFSVLYTAFSSSVTCCSHSVFSLNCGESKRAGNPYVPSSIAAGAERAGEPSADSTSRHGGVGSTALSAVAW
jgi:hypothetical protein